MGYFKRICIFFDEILHFSNFSYMRIQIIYKFGKKLYNMKVVKRILMFLGLLLLVITVGFYTFITLNVNKDFGVLAPDIEASTDSSIIARGKYICYGPGHCNGCHTPWSMLENIKPGEITPLSGGNIFKLEIGDIVTPNLTSDKQYGLGSYTDAQIARSLRHNVSSKDGSTLFPIMPFQNLSDDDIQAVVSYLRTLQPISNETPKTEYNFLGKAIKVFTFKPTQPEIDTKKHLNPDTTVEYGEYLASNIANCKGCHTNRDLKTGAFVGEFFAGGFEMPSNLESGVVCVTPNITTDKETGKLANWTQEIFIQRFKQGRVIKASEMPWESFASMTENDLKAIYNYLKTVKPVKNDTSPTVRKVQES